MSHAIVSDLRQERETLVAKINALLDVTKERGAKDVSDEDLESINRMRARCESIDRQLETLSNDFGMDPDLEDRLRSLDKGSAPTAPKYRSAGELLWDCLHANFGSQHDRDDREARDRWDRVMKRVEHMGTTAEDTTATAGGFGNLWVAPTVGPIIDLSPMSQPFLTAMGKRRAPNSIDFSRPRLVDPNFKTGAGVQTLQKAELTSKAFDVKTSPISLNTYGGYLNVSQQLLSLHPEALNIIVNQLQRRVAWQGEAAAITELSQSDSEVPLATGADSEDVIGALYDAAVKVWEQTGELPTWIAFGPLGWARLGKLVDDVNRPLFPFLGAQNALGTGGINNANLGTGMREILTPGISSVDIWIGNSYALEVYSYPFPVLEAVEPSVFGRQIAVAEALAFFRPITDENSNPVEGNGAVRIGPAS